MVGKYFPPTHRNRVNGFSCLKKYHYMIIINIDELEGLKQLMKMKLFLKKKIISVFIIQNVMAAYAKFPAPIVFFSRKP